MRPRGWHAVSSQPGKVSSTATWEGEFYRYEPSPRRYPTKLREPEYGDDVVVYRVKPNGAIMQIHYGPLYLGRLSAKGRLTRGHKRRRRTQEKNDEIPTIQTT